MNTVTPVDIDAPILGRYVLTREFRRDAFGILYLAADTEDGSYALLRVVDSAISGNENFLLRFELLKSLLPLVSHPRVVPIKTLDTDKNVYYIVYQVQGLSSGRIETLEDFDWKGAANPERCFEDLMEGVVSGLCALEGVQNGYYQKGIVHDALRPASIFIQHRLADGTGQVETTAQVAGYAETFLFFGEEPQAALHARISQACHTWQEDLIAEDFFHEEHLYPPSTRRGICAHEENQSLYSFGKLLYQLLSGRPLRGKYTPLRDDNLKIAPLWDEVIQSCLQAIHGQGYSSMVEVHERLSKHIAARVDLSPEEQFLRELEVPHGMVLVPLTSKVELGASDGPLVEQPRFRAKIKPFFIDETPVTVEEFLRFMPSYTPSSYSRGADQPATLVSQAMAKAYCEWRSEKEGLPPGSYRLPTEYEWEAAARGTMGEQYPWGESFDGERTRCALEKEAGTGPVRALSPGRFGLFSMLGNVWEWTSSRFRPHPFSSHEERGYEHRLFVVKGGCWMTSEEQCRGSLRAAFRTTERRGNIGFRCLREVEMPSFGQDSMDKS